MVRCRTNGDGVGGSGRWEVERRGWGLVEQNAEGSFVFESWLIGALDF